MTAMPLDTVSGGFGQISTSEIRKRIEMISIVCVYNNRSILDSCLLKSLKHQTRKYELITLDNTKGKFKSAAQALNQGAKKAKGKYIMFVHNDVDLSSDAWLEEAEKLLDGLPCFGIAGVAGISEEKKYLVTNIEHGCPPRPAGAKQPTNPVKAQTLDECLILIPRRIFNSLQFDESTCNDWHLYAVDYCLSAKRLGYSAYILPLYAYHASQGCLSQGFYSSLKRLMEKHKRLGWIYTCTGTWNTHLPFGLQTIRLFQLALAGIRILLRDGPVIFISRLFSYLCNFSLCG